VIISTISSRLTPFSMAFPRWEGKLVRPIERDQAGDRDQAAVALAQALTAPDLAEQNGVGDLRKSRRDVAPGRALSLLGHRPRSSLKASLI
jgi:hypothetical protein